RKWFGKSKEASTPSRADSPKTGSKPQSRSSTKAKALGATELLHSPSSLESSDRGGSEEEEIVWTNNSNQFTKAAVRRRVERIWASRAIKVDRRSSSDSATPVPGDGASPEPGHYWDGHVTLSKTDDENANDGPELTVLISRTRASRRPGSAVRGPRVRGGFAGGCVVCLEDPSASRQHPASALATLDRKPTVGPTMSYRGKKPGGVKSPSSKESSLISSSDPKS
ncbi:hypothetical protein HPB47_018596, partial [Ixodes persulcatus]